jgi:hypothetical protein
MSNNPFKPPETEAKDKPPQPGSPVRAVLTGLAVDIGGSLLTGLVLELFYQARLAASGMTSDQIDDALEKLGPDSPVEIVGLLLGCLCSVLGGYVCARIVRRDEYRVGGVMAALSGLLGLLFGSAGTSDDLTTLFALTTVACVLLGVKYGREHNRRSAPSPAPPAGAPRP